MRPESKGRLNARFSAGIVRASVLGTLALLTLKVWAHGPDQASLAPKISSAFVQPEGVRLDLIKTTSWQFALASDGTHTIQILDQSNRPFIQIQKNQVRANLNAVAWFRAQTPGGGRVPEKLTQAPPKEAFWQPIAEQTGYGWYDSRLLKTDGKSFSLKLTIDGKPLNVPIVFKPIAPMTGYWHAVVNQDLDSKGLTALIPGQSGSVILLSRHQDAQTPAFFVLDDHHRAFLKLTDSGVWVKTTHPWFNRLDIRVAESSRAIWQKVTAGNTVSYNDPRIARQNKAHQPFSWHIPVHISGAKTPLNITGERTWRAFTQSGTH